MRATRRRGGRGSDISSPSWVTPPVCEFLETRRLYAVGYETGKDIREVTDKIEKFALVHQELHRPPTALLTWGTGLAFVTAAHSTNAAGKPVIAVDTYLSNGRGGFDPLGHTDCDDADPSAAIFIATGDVNGDGISDVTLKLFSVTGQPTPVGEAYDSTITTLIADGRGGLEPRKSFVLPHVLESSRAVVPKHVFDVIGRSGIAVGDVNGDGTADLVDWAGDSVVTVVMSKGGVRTMGEGEPWIGDISAAARRPVTTAGLADLDGDGRADLIGFTDDALLSASWDGSAFKILPKITGFTPTSARIDHVLIADLDGDDATDDLAVLAGKDVLRGTNHTKSDPAGGSSVASFSWGASQLPQHMTWVDVHAGDLDGDGKDDLFSLNDKKHRYVGTVTIVK